MIYVFDNEVFFCLKTRTIGTVICTNNQYQYTNRIDVSPTHARLLRELLNNRENDIISRDLLLKNVWCNHGLVGSLNVLNQYLSRTRKTFKHLGFKKDVILSTPKLGISVNPDIVIKEHFTIEKTKTKDSRLCNIFRHNKWHGVTALISFIFTFMCFHFNYSISSINDSHQYEITIEQCDDFLKEKFNGDIPSGEFCINGYQFFLGTYFHLLDEKLTAGAITRCRLGNDSYIDSCKSYF